MEEIFSKLGEIIWSRDFVVNLLAGLATFILDILLITLWLPAILQKRMDMRWRPDGRPCVILSWKD
jgi:hypothetical protein